ncbi:MAG: dTMP kinase [Verrucomicrobiota bacterium]
MSGHFITFEGSEGCGKSTQLARLAAWLREQGHDVVETREPGGTELGKNIRELLMHRQGEERLCSESELLLFAADRAQHVRQLIRPALAAGKTLLSDRYLDSTTAYQGVARKLSAENVAMINRFATVDCLPDLTLVLDLPVETGLERARQATGQANDRMEAEAIAFYEAVRQGFLDLAEAEPQRIAVIDADADPDTVEARIRAVVSERRGL